MKILFICTGNTCRSPMAEAMLKSRSNFEVQSAGISQVSGLPTNEQAVQALKNKNITHSGSSQPVTDELIDWADLILTMTKQHKKIVVNHYPETSDKIHTLKEYVRDDEDDATWQALKQAYLNLEEKRMLVKEEHGNQLTEQQWRAFLREEQDEIDRLEKELPSDNISDPFGREQEVYDETLEEISEAIDALIKKLTE